MQALEAAGPDVAAQLEAAAAEDDGAEDWRWEIQAELARSNDRGVVILKRTPKAIRADVQRRIAELVASVGGREDRGAQVFPVDQAEALTVALVGAGIGVNDRLRGGRDRPAAVRWGAAAPAPTPPPAPEGLSPRVLELVDLVIVDLAAADVVRGLARVWREPHRIAMTARSYLRDLVSSQVMDRLPASLFEARVLDLANRKILAREKDGPGYGLATGEKAKSAARQAAELSPSKLQEELNAALAPPPDSFALPDSPIVSVDHLRTSDRVVFSFTNLTVPPGTREWMRVVEGLARQFRAVLIGGGRKIEARPEMAAEILAGVQAAGFLVQDNRPQAAPPPAPPAPPPPPPAPPRYVGPQVSLMEAAPPRYGAAEGETGALFGDVEPAPIPWQLAALPIAVRYQGDAIRGLQLAPDLVDLAGGVMPVPLGSEAAGYYPEADEADQDAAGRLGVVLVQVGQPVDESTEVAAMNEQLDEWISADADKLRAPPASRYLLIGADEYGSGYVRSAEGFYAGKVRASRLLGAPEVEALAGSGLFFYAGGGDLPINSNQAPIPEADLAQATTSSRQRAQIRAYGLTLHRLDLSGVEDQRSKEADRADKEREAERQLEAEERMSADEKNRLWEEYQAAQRAEREAEEAARASQLATLDLTPRSWPAETAEWPIHESFSPLRINQGPPGVSRSEDDTAYTIAWGGGLLSPGRDGHYRVVSRAFRGPELVWVSKGDYAYSLGTFKSPVQARQIGQMLGPISDEDALFLSRNRIGEDQKNIFHSPVTARFYELIHQTEKLKFTPPYTTIPPETRPVPFTVPGLAIENLVKVYVQPLSETNQERLDLAITTGERLRPLPMTGSVLAYEQRGIAYGPGSIMPSPDEMAPFFRWLLGRYPIAALLVARTRSMLFEGWAEYDRTLAECLVPFKGRLEARREADARQREQEKREEGPLVDARPLATDGAQLPLEAEAHGVKIQAYTNDPPRIVLRRGIQTATMQEAPGTSPRVLGALVRVLASQSADVLRGFLNRPGRLAQGGISKALDLEASAVGFLNELDDRLTPGRKTLWQTVRGGPVLNDASYRPGGSLVAAAKKREGDKTNDVIHLPTGLRVTSVATQDEARALVDWINKRHTVTYDEGYNADGGQALSRKVSGMADFLAGLKDAKKDEAREKKEQKEAADRAKKITPTNLADATRNAAEINRENKANKAAGKDGWPDNLTRSVIPSFEGFSVRLAVVVQDPSNEPNRQFSLTDRDVETVNIRGFWAWRKAKDTYFFYHLGGGINLFALGPDKGRETRGDSMRESRPEVRRLAAENLLRLLETIEIKGDSPWGWSDRVYVGDQIKSVAEVYDFDDLVTQAVTDARRGLESERAYPKGVEPPKKPREVWQRKAAEQNRSERHNTAGQNQPPKYTGDPPVSTVLLVNVNDAGTDLETGAYERREGILGFFAWDFLRGEKPVRLIHIGTGETMAIFGPSSRVLGQGRLHGYAVDEAFKPGISYGDQKFKLELAARNAARALMAMEPSPWAWGDVMSHEDQLKIAGRKYNIPATIGKAAMWAGINRVMEEGPVLERTENPRRTTARPAPGYSPPQGPDLAARRAARPAAERAARHIRENVDAFYGDRISYEDFSVGQRQIYDTLSPVESLAVSAILRGDLAWFEGRTENPAATVRNPGKDVAAWVARCKEGKAQIRAFELDARAVADRLLQIKRAELVDARVKACDAPRAEVRAKFDRQIAQLQREAQRLEAQARKATEGEKAATRGKLPRLPRAASDALIEGSLLAMEPRLVPAWRKAAAMIEGDSPSQRLEVFLIYAADNPGEVTSALEAAGPELAKQLEGLPPLRLAGLEAPAGALEAPATPAAPLLAPVPETDTFYRAILPKVISDGGRYLVRLLLGVPDYTATEGDLYAAFSQAFPGDDQAWWSGIQQIAGLSLDTSPIAVEQIGPEYDVFRLVFSRVDAPPDPPEAPPPPPAPRGSVYDATRAAYDAGALAEKAVTAADHLEAAAAFDRAALLYADTAERWMVSGLEELAAKHRALGAEAPELANDAGPPPAPTDAPPRSLEGEPPAVLLPMPATVDEQITAEGRRISRHNAIVRARMIWANHATVEGVIDLARRLMEQKAAIQSRDVHKTMGERADREVLVKLGLDPSKTLAPAVIDRLVSLGFEDGDARSLVSTRMANIVRPRGPQSIRDFLRTMESLATKSEYRLYPPTEATAPAPRPAPTFGRSLVPSTDPPPEAPTAAALGVPVSMDDLDRLEAERAYQHTSHTPERRGDEDRREYVRHLEAVARELRGLYPNATAEELRVQLDGYRTGYLSRLRHYHYTHSNAASTMITGRSGVNVRQMQKRNDSADQALATLRDYSERVRAAWRRDANKASGGGPIRADQANALELLREKLKEARRQRAALPEIRKIARDRKASAADREARLVALGLSAATARELVASGAQINSASLYGEINRLEGRIHQLEKEKGRPTVEYETTMPSADGSRAYPVRVVDNAEDNRIQLFFSERIDAATAGKLKGRGMKWAPSVQAWQRQRTDNARSALGWGLGIKLPAPSAPAAAPVVEAQGDAELARQAIDEWAGQQAQAAAERQAAELAPAAPVADPMGPEIPTNPEGEAQAMAQAQERAKQARAAASDPQAAVKLEREKLERMRQVNAILRRTPIPALYSKEWGERVAELYALGIPPKAARNLASPMRGKLPGYEDIEFRMAEDRLARLASRTANPSSLAPQHAAAKLPWGKHLPEAVYVHRSGREDLPPVMRQALERAREVAGRVSFDVVKFSTVAPVVSLLSYPRFFDDARPALEQSVTVHLDTDEVRRHAYRGRKAPVIHKKHLMMPPERTENPSRTPAAAGKAEVWTEDGKIKVRAPYNQAFIAGALQLGGRYNKGAGWWYFPADAGPKVRGLVAQLGRTPNPCACSLDP